MARAYGVAAADSPYPRRWTFVIGTGGKILHIDKQVNPGSHGEDLVKLLESLGVAGKD